MLTHPTGEIVEIVGKFPTEMDIHVQNITHVDVYWQKTLLFDYESIKCSSMDMSKVLLEYTGFQMVWIDGL